MQYGFTVLFVSAFPLAPTIAMISGYIQIRIDGWKLCQAVRRPQPKVAEDIGSWQDMIEILSMVGVIFNFGQLFYTGSYLKNYTLTFRWIMFICIEHVALGLKYLIALYIDDIPEEVQIQLERLLSLCCVSSMCGLNTHVDDCGDLYFYLSPMST